MSFTAIKPEEIQDINDFKVIDVRSEQEFHGELGHISTALLAPLPGILKAALQWQKDQKILLVCRSGRRSQVACLQLSLFGFADLYNLTGGMLAWNAYTQNENDSEGRTC